MQTKFNEEEIELLHQMLDKLIESGDNSIYTRKAELQAIDFSNLDDECKIKIKGYRLCLYTDDK